MRRRSFRIRERELGSPSMLKCPNCGGTHFTATEQNSQRCEYCGTVLEPAQPVTRIGECPRCRFKNEPDARYCSECGLALGKWTPNQKSKLDPAVISIAATIIGSMFVPVGGAILGLFLAYKAREQARSTQGSRDMARIAILVGWIGLGIFIIPMCLFPLMMGGQIGLTICGGMRELPRIAFGP